MLKRTFVLIILLFSILGVGAKQIDQNSRGFSFNSRFEPFKNSITIKTPQVQLSEDFKQNCTLIQSYKFYKGSLPMSEIKTITFTSKRPVSYDEFWYANENNSKMLMGYRKGQDVYIVGFKIYTSWKCSYMFAGEDTDGEPLWSSLERIEGLERLDTSQATTMKLMFAFTKVAELKGIDQWDVSKVTDFSAMFQGHDNSGDAPFVTLDIANWNTSSAFSFSHMFYGCGSLTSIPIDNWDVSRAGSFSHMFADCYNLKSLNLTKWQTNSAINFDAFLNDCHSLTSIDVSTLNTSQVEQFSQMFEACTNLQEIIGINNWDVSSACRYAFSETFHCCYNLKSLVLSNWRAVPDNTARMFKNCYALEFLDISGLDLSCAITDEMYDGCKNLKFL